MPLQRHLNNCEENTWENVKRSNKKKSNCFRSFSVLFVSFFINSFTDIVFHRISSVTIDFLLFWTNLFYFIFVVFMYVFYYFSIHNPFFLFLSLLKIFLFSSISFLIINHKRFHCYPLVIFFLFIFIYLFICFSFPFIHFFFLIFFFVFR